jgi:hypothetical protein
MTYWDEQDEDAFADAQAERAMEAEQVTRWVPAPRVLDPYWDAAEIRAQKAQAEGATFQLREAALCRASAAAAAAYQRWYDARDASDAAYAAYEEAVDKRYDSAAYNRLYEANHELEAADLAIASFREACA